MTCMCENASQRRIIVTGSEGGRECSLSGSSRRRGSDARLDTLGGSGGRGGRRGSDARLDTLGSSGGRGGGRGARIAGQRGLAFGSAQLTGWQSGHWLALGFGFALLLCILGIGGSVRRSGSA